MVPLHSLKKSLNTHEWYPEEIRTANDGVHRTCRAALGLYPLPDDDLPLADVIGAKVTARIAEVAGQHPEVRGLRALTDLVSAKLMQEYHIPTDNGRQQLRWMISRWVTTHLASGRGGVSAKDDFRMATPRDQS